MKVSLGRTRDDGETIEVEGDQKLALRAEGPALPAINPILAVVETLKLKGKTSAILDAEFEDASIVIEDVAQAFFVVFDPKETKDATDSSVTTRRESGEELDNVPVPTRRVPNTQIFVGPFRLVPEGHPDLKRPL